MTHAFLTVPPRLSVLISRAHDSDLAIERSELDVAVEGEFVRILECDGHVFVLLTNFFAFEQH